MLDNYYLRPQEYINYSHTRDNNPSNTDFHLHDMFEIYFFISGNVNYFIEKKVYSLKYGDLLVINSSEIHRPSFLPGPGYERIVIHFEPAIIRLFNTPGFNLLNCFVNRSKGDQNKINLDTNQIDELLRMFKKIEGLVRNPIEGSDILKLTCFIELLVFINRLFLSVAPMKEHPNVPEKLIPILDYIDGNLESDLSLELLERKFFINRFYLSRLFKKSTGANLCEYIKLKRVSKAKKLLLSGYNVTDSCTLSGFNDYSNFIRTFKKTVGVSPMQYKKTNSYTTA